MSSYNNSHWEHSTSITLIIVTSIFIIQIFQLSVFPISYNVVIKDNNECIISFLDRIKSCYLIEIEYRLKRCIKHSIEDLLDCAVPDNKTKKNINL